MKNQEIKFRDNLDSYSVFIGSNTLNILPHQIKKLCPKTKKIALIIDKKIPNKFKKILKRKLKNYNVFLFSFSSNEKMKSFKTVDSFLKKLLSKNFNRSDLVIGVGGGITGDVVSFVASIYKRGINFINIPTTLLAQVDSAIGGKTGINLKDGKNLVGRIYQPIAVEIDTNFLSTLPARELQAALAEVVKYGFIYDREFFDYLVANSIKIENKDIDVLQKIIIQCCEIKSDIVSEDENENELRMILNFGHTVGHAIESFTDYKNLLHGEAIFYGMKCALYLSNKFGNLSNDEYDISTQLLSKFELPKLDIDNRETFINFVKNDKKFREKKIRFILLDEIGKSRISKDITFDQIKESLSVL